MPTTLQLHSGSLAPEIWRPSLGAAPLVRSICSTKALLLCPLRCRLLPHLSLRRPSRLLCPLLSARRPPPPPGRRESPGGPFRRFVPFCLQGELVTASKAIIEKEYQPHVIVSTTGPNPFNTLTDRELEEYRREVERKQKGPEGEPRAVPGETEACEHLVPRGLQVHVLTSAGLVPEDVESPHGSDWSGWESPRVREVLPAVRCGGGDPCWSEHHSSTRWGLKGALLVSAAVKPVVGEKGERESVGLCGLGSPGRSSPVQVPGCAGQCSLS